MTDIGVLAWGSLVWRPTHCEATLELRTPGQSEPDGPPLPLEFARISRDGSLTLVVVPDYPHLVSALWSVSAFDDVDAAVRNLAGRECIRTNLSSIHGVDQDGSPVGSVHMQIASTVQRWLRDHPASLKAPSGQASRLNRVAGASADTTTASRLTMQSRTSCHSKTIKTTRPSTT